MTIKFYKYDKYGAYHWHWYQYKKTYIDHVNKVKDWIKEKNVLDVGAGDGLITSILGARGIDNEPAGVKLARERGVDVILGDAHNLPFKDEEFEAVFMGDTLEHLEFPEKAIKEARRVLKHYLYLSTPMKGGGWDVLQYREWSPEELKEMVENQGFKMIGDMEMVGKRSFRKSYAKFEKI